MGGAVVGESRRQPVECAIKVFQTTSWKVHIRKAPIPQDAVAASVWIHLEHPVREAVTVNRVADGFQQPAANPQLIPGGNIHGVAGAAVKVQSEYGPGVMQSATACGRKVMVIADLEIQIPILKFVPLRETSQFAIAGAV